uniref:Ig-like domain-containing protein n=1 Tax=Kryptolebias marmoratus TaxID=37003 RepID=A0A3Q3GRJ6_KRYMA
AAGVTIQYPFLSTCAFKGSTVTLPCSFTPLKSFNRDGREIPLKVVRVRWCKNHELCHSTTPSVFDSNSTTNDPGYEYLGDLKGNCTLRIRNIKTSDEPTFRFRMEADDSAGHFVNRTGVKVSVVGENNTGGQSVSLQCTSPFCTFYHLNITWTKDGHALPETGPALQLGPLTSEDSGNYTCGLKTNSRSRSEPIRLQVEAEGGKMATETIIRLVLFGALTLLNVILVSIVIRRYLHQYKHTSSSSSSSVQTENDTSLLFQDVLFAEQQQGGASSAGTGELHHRSDAPPIGGAGTRA